MPRVMVLGILGQMPFAGVAWQVLHYLEGFRRLGCDVYYVEDTGAWPYDAERNTITDDCRYTVDYIARLMGRGGLDDRWAYRAPSPEGRTFGLGQPHLSRLVGQTDVLVNLSGATVLRDEYRRVPIRIYLETDPVLPQIEIAKGRASTIELLAAHTHHFSYGENLGAPDCGVPVERFHYSPTRQPVVLDWWRSPGAPPPLAPFTTIANWRQSGKDVEWNGETYLWSKHAEFLKFLDLPRRTTHALELALACDDIGTIRLLETRGWWVRDAIQLSRDVGSYREYIWGSRGEFTVAKDQNVRLRSGWFSDRSACYLAAGRPVITQDTGFGAVLPTGRGLCAFRTADEIVESLKQITLDYEAHSAAAREIAEEHFAAERVLAGLLERAGL